MTMSQAVLVALQHMTEDERDLWRRNMIKQISVETKDYLKTKKDNPGIAIYEIHDPKWNIARRRRGKSSYFSMQA